MVEAPQPSNWGRNGLGLSEVGEKQPMEKQWPGTLACERHHRWSIQIAWTGIMC